VSRNKQKWKSQHEQKSKNWKKRSRMSRRNNNKSNRNNNLLKKLPRKRRRERIKIRNLIRLTETQLHRSMLRFKRALVSS